MIRITVDTNVLVSATFWYGASYRILECAVAGDVNYLISKDNHLLKIVKYGKIKIVSPEEFLKLF